MGPRITLPEKFWNNHLLKSKREELSSRERSPVREKDISPRHNFKEKDRWIDSFRGKLDPSSPKITPEEIIDGERRRLKRLRRSSEEPKHESSSAQLPIGGIDRDMEMDDAKVVSRLKPVAANRMKLAMRLKQIQSGNKTKAPSFEIGEEITFEDYNNHIRGSGKVTKVILPGERGNAYPDGVGELEIPEILYEIDTIAEDFRGRRGWIRESTIKKKRQQATSLLIVMVTALHPMDYVGIDTCSAVSASTERADFVYLDESQEAKDSVSLNGVGAGGPEVVGRGPMVVSAIDTYGNQIFMLDPAGFLIRSSDDQAKLRILGQQRMKRFGFTIVQDYVTDEDRLIYRDEVHIRFTTINGILMVKTVPWGLDAMQLSKLERMIEDHQNKNLDYFCILLEESNIEEHYENEKVTNNQPVLYDKETNQPVFIIYEAKLTKTEMERVDHWRNAHRSSDGSRYKERCHTCEQAKHKSVYKRNSFFQGTAVSMSEI